MVFVVFFIDIIVKFFCSGYYFFRLGMRYIVIVDCYVDFYVWCYMFIDNFDNMIYCFGVIIGLLCDFDNYKLFIFGF